MGPMSKAVLDAVATHKYAQRSYMQDRVIQPATAAYAVVVILYHSTQRVSQVNPMQDQSMYPSIAARHLQASIYRASDQHLTCTRMCPGSTSLQNFFWSTKQAFISLTCSLISCAASFSTRTTWDRQSQWSCLLFASCRSSDIVTATEQPWNEWMDEW